MPRAILRDGVFFPIEPLPPDWTDGSEVWVEEARPKSPEELEKWAKELESLVAKIDAEDARRIEAALAEAKKLAKDMVRREMGLP